MGKDLILEKICYMHSLDWSDLSIIDQKKWILEKEKYKKFFRKHKLTIVDIENYLIGKDDLIDKWIMFSENKRGSGYYFVRENNVYVIGYISLWRNKIILKTNNKQNACAHFIMYSLKLK